MHIVNSDNKRTCTYGEIFAFHVPFGREDKHEAITLGSALAHLEERRRSRGEHNNFSMSIWIAIKRSEVVSGASRLSKTSQNS